MFCYDEEVADRRQEALGRTIAFKVRRPRRICVDLTAKLNPAYPLMAFQEAWQLFGSPEGATNCD